MAEQYLMLSNLPYNVIEEDIENFLKQYANVKPVHIFMEHHAEFGTGRAIVSFDAGTDLSVLINTLRKNDVIARHYRAARLRPVRSDDYVYYDRYGSRELPRYHDYPASDYRTGAVREYPDRRFDDAPRDGRNDRTARDGMDARVARNDSRVESMSDVAILSALGYDWFRNVTMRRDALARRPSKSVLAFVDDVNSLLLRSGLEKVHLLPGFFQKEPLIKYRNKAYMYTDFASWFCNDIECSRWILSFLREEVGINDFGGYSFSKDMQEKLQVFAVIVSCAEVGRGFGNYSSSMICFSDGYPLVH